MGSKIIDWLRNKMGENLIGFIPYHRNKQLGRMFDVVEYYYTHKKINKKQIKEMDLKMADCMGRISLLESTNTSSRKPILDLMESYYKDWKEIANNKITKNNMMVLVKNIS